MEQPTKEETQRPGFGRRFCLEFKTPFFGLEDTYFGMLDMTRNFSIGKGFFSPVALIKFIFFGLAAAALGWAFYAHPVTEFYIAYVSCWQVIYCVLYLGASWMLSTCGDQATNKASALLKFTWVMFSVAAVHGVTTTIIYWVFLWSPSRGLDVSNTSTHGGTFLLVIIDGLVINRTPVRIKHIVANWTLAFLYLIWSILQNVVIKYNPVDDDDDDAIYDIMKWRENTTGAIIMAVALVFGCLPLFTFIFWSISLCGRHYRESDIPENKNLAMENGPEIAMESDQQDPEAAIE